MAFDLDQDDDKMNRSIEELTLSSDSEDEAEIKKDSKSTAGKQTENTENGKIKTAYGLFSMFTGKGKVASSENPSTQTKKNTSGNVAKAKAKFGGLMKKAQGFLGFV